MVGTSSLVPVWAPVTAAGVISTASAVVVNLATGGGPWWLWAVVAVLMAAGIAASLWLHRRQTGTPPSTVTASGERSVAVQGTAASIRTGNLGVPASPAASASPGNPQT